MRKTLDLKNCKIRDIREFLKEIDDDVELDFNCTGKTGFVNNLELEINTYESFKPDVCINIEAESGY